MLTGRVGYAMNMNPRLVPKVSWQSQRSGHVTTTYFIAAQVSPLPDNPLSEKVLEAYVYFWVVDSEPDKAMNRATEYLVSYKWKLEKIDNGPVETTAADFADQEEGLKGFWRAKQKGFAAHFVGKPKPGQIEPEKPGSE